MAETLTDTDYRTDKEPATAHDVSEGGVLGAVGGAVVGGIAGGPVGAVIGAVVGGLASAGAVDVVDKHDHDYARTAYRDNEVDADDTAVEDDLTTRPTDYREDTSYGTTATAASPVQDATYRDTTTPVTANANYAGTTAPVMDNGNYRDTTALRDNETVIPVVEEELQVGKRVEQTGGARVHTEVIETPVEESVNLREEHVTVDRRPVDRAATDADFNTGARDINITETREVPVVAKEARVVEEVVIGKAVTDRTEAVRDTVRRTDVVVDEDDTAATTTAATTRTGSTY